MAIKGPTEGRCSYTRSDAFSYRSMSLHSFRLVPRARTSGPDDYLRPMSSRDVPRYEHSHRKQVVNVVSVMCS
jgi:hypothetical protein